MTDAEIQYLFASSRVALASLVPVFFFNVSKTTTCICSKTSSSNNANNNTNTNNINNNKLIKIVMIVILHSVLRLFCNPPAGRLKAVIRIGMARLTLWSSSCGCQGLSGLLELEFRV